MKLNIHIRKLFDNESKFFNSYYYIYAYDRKQIW